MSRPQPTTPGFYDEIEDEVDGGDPPEKCRHGRYLYCDSCIAATHMLAVAIGRHDGAMLIADKLRHAVGALFAKGHDDEARQLREYLRDIERLAKEYADRADEERERQGIIKRGKR